MIPGNDRLVIISGMAHSGTTLLAYLLAQHPELFLAVDGWQSPLLETDLLPRENAYAIEWLLRANPAKRLVLKRPWITANKAQWLLWNLPQAKYLYCVREFGAIANSWKKPTSFVEKSLREGDEKYQRDIYDSDLARADDLARRVPHFLKVSHEELLARPELIHEIAAWLDLAPFQFDTSIVGGKNVKEVIKG